MYLAPSALCLVYNGITMVKNIAYFQYPWRQWRVRLAGIYRYAERAGWHVQVIEHGLTALPVRKAIKFWNPDGCIVERSVMELPGFRQSGFPFLFEALLMRPLFAAVGIHLEHIALVCAVGVHRSPQAQRHDDYQDDNDGENRIDNHDTLQADGKN